MVRTSVETAAYLRNLTTQVQNGLLSKSEAKRRAIQALNEVAEAEPDDATPAPSEETKSEEKPVEKKVAPAIDPKTRILSLLTRFEESIQGSLKKLEQDVTSIIKETSGDAVPLGDFNIGNDIEGGLSNDTKLVIETGDKPAQVLITYNLKKAWNVEDMMLPVQACASTCHLPLRQELLALCTEIRDESDSELSWKRSKKESFHNLNHIETLAKTSGDKKVLEILDGKPADELADNWMMWATASQAYLLGSDWSDGKNFSVIRNRTTYNR